MPAFDWIRLTGTYLQLRPTFNIIIRPRLKVARTLWLTLMTTLSNGLWVRTTTVLFAQEAGI